LLVNWFFVEPYYTMTIAEPEHIVSLAVFVGVAITVGSSSTPRRRAHEAQRAVEATALARSAATLAADPERYRV
jgi:two-component system sensor histidine kinase KdpD